MSIVDSVIGKNMAIKELFESRRIGRKNGIIDYFLGSGTTDTFTPNEDLGGLCGEIVSFTAKPEHKIANEWCVFWNEREYNYDTTGELGGVWLGNHSIADPENEDTGEPFLFVIDLEQESMLVLANEAGEYCWKVFCVEDDYIPIAPGYLGVVEIDLADYGIDLATILMSGNVKTTIDNGALWKKVRKAREVVVKVRYSGSYSLLTATQYGYDENGVPGGLSFGLNLIMNNALIGVNVYLTSLINGDTGEITGTNVYYTTTTTPLT